MDIIETVLHLEHKFGGKVKAAHSVSHEQSVIYVECTVVFNDRPKPVRVNVLPSHLVRTGMEGWVERELIGDAINAYMLDKGRFETNGKWVPKDRPRAKRESA